MMNSKTMCVLRVVVLVAMLFGPVASSMAAEKIRMKGKAVSVPEYGFGAMPRRDAGVVAVLYKPYGAALMLPYSKNWKFQIEDDGRVTGEAKEYSFTLTATDSRIATEKEYLEAIVANLRSSPFLLRNVELLDVKGDVVLRYQSRPEKLPKEYASLDPWCGPQRGGCESTLTDHPTTKPFASTARAPDGWHCTLFADRNRPNDGAASRSAMRH